MLLLQSQNKEIFNLIKSLLMKFNELYKLLESDGWTIKSGKKHHKYVHPEKKGFIPVGRHPSKEVPDGTLCKILKDAGLK